jgi:hypothetical protein
MTRGQLFAAVTVDLLLSIGAQLLAPAFAASQTRRVKNFYL